MAIRVYIANKHEIVREGLKTTLSKSPYLNLYNDYYDTNDLYYVIDRIKPNLIFIDIFKLDNILLNNISRIRDVYPKILIVGIIYSDSNEIIDYVLKCKLNGIFHLNFSVEEFVRGISTVVSKGYYVQNAISKKINDYDSSLKADKFKINSLTKRELEVLVQVANGMFNKEIAISLNISERTVKNHLSNIFKKIEVADRTQAAVFAIKNGIVNI